MKQERGITLISLIVYVILMTFIVAGVSAITSSFYNNVNSFDKSSESAVSFSKFNMYFLKDIKSDNVKIVNYTSGSGETAVSTTDKKVLTLSMTNEEGKIQTATYEMKDGGLYRDNVKICDDVQDVKFTTYQKTKNLVSVYIKFKNYEKTTSYILEPKNAETNIPII